MSADTTSTAPVEAKPPHQAFCGRLESSLRWSVLNRISDNAVLNAGYLGAVAIPVAALVISRLNTLPIFEIQLGWPLLIAYAASLSLATGKLLFFIGCPKIIRYYNNFTRYVSELDDLIRALDALTEWKTAASVRRKRDEIVSTMTKKGVPEAAAEAAADLLSAYQQKILEADVLDDIEELVVQYDGKWRKAEHKRQAVRYSIGLLYLSSALMSAYLFFWVGLSRVISTAFGG